MLTRRPQRIRFRMVGAGCVALLASISLAGCDGSPESPNPQESAATSGTDDQATTDAMVGPPTSLPFDHNRLTAPGTRLGFGQPAVVQVPRSVAGQWVAEVAVTEWAQVPNADFEALGLPPDTPQAYYARYTVTAVHADQGRGSLLWPTETLRPAGSQTAGPIDFFLHSEPPCEATTTPLKQVGDSLTSCMIFTPPEKTGEVQVVPDGRVPIAAWSAE